MFFKRKKIRQLNQMLDAAQQPHDLKEVVDAFENAGPNAAHPGFQKKLRQQLLQKYQTVATVHNDTQAVAERPPMRMKSWAVALTVLVLLAVAGVATYPLI